MSYINDGHRDNCSHQAVNIDLSQTISPFYMLDPITTASMLGRPRGFDRRVKTVFGLNDEKPSIQT
jgi:hypothetical protein